MRPHWRRSMPFANLLLKGSAMFRLLRLKPPHGWNAVGWELGIVN